MVREGDTDDRRDHTEAEGTEEAPKQGAGVRALGRFGLEFN